MSWRRGLSERMLDLWRSRVTVGARNEAARNAWVEARLRELPAGVRLLDAGAGEGRYRDLCRHLRYVSQDFAQYDGQGDGTGQQTRRWDTSRIDLVCDITAIPEPEGSFDAILCTEVLEHLPDPLAALREFARLLRPGGRLILTAPFVSFTHFAPYHFVAGFNRYFFRHHLPVLGFEIVDLVANGSFFDLLAQEVRRLPSKAVEYAGRPLSWLETAVAGLLIVVLQRCARRDRRSWEFACYGYHVVATRRGSVGRGSR